jgi:rubrerythrin
VPQETNAKKMLQNVAEAETTARNNYSVRAKQADELGEVGLANRWKTWRTTNRATWTKPSKFCAAGIR